MEFTKYENKMEYPSTPKKPFLKRDHTLEEIEIYTKDFKQYEKDIQIYRKKLKEYRENETLLIQQFKEDLFKEYNVKDKAKGEKIYSLAWEEGHSNGLKEVENYFDRYIEIARDLGAEI
jgi:hypothetical protein